MLTIDKKHLTYAESAVLAEVHPRTIERWIALGRVDAVKVAGKTLVVRESLERLLAGVPVEVRS